MDRITRIPAPQFDLALTLDSGQVFHWNSSGNGFLGTIGDQPVYLEQRGDALLIYPAAAVKASTHYFSLDHPLAKICASFPDEPVMREAASSCRGLRIIRQPRWECLATFITSSMKQVVHIRQISRSLRERYGEALRVRGDRLYAFPAAARLAATTVKELRESALGYRAKNLLATARMVASGAVDLDALASLPDDELRAALCELPGVGPKVANCVMLFAYERLSAFPIDVWIERVLRENYFPRRRNPTVGDLRDFAARHFGPYGGYAQQYLFHHARKRARQRLSPRPA
ncbi:MAG TPA: DNA glycosylase [Chthoniobacterales bacterium]|nr:DNA glycosylase [Chthoniobacterales bacterium]